MQFQTLAQIQAHQFKGNHFADSAAFWAIEQFASDTGNSMHDRAEALREMALRGMGLTPTEAGSDQADEAFVAEYMQSIDD